MGMTMANGGTNRKIMHFSIGDVNVSLATPIRTLRRQYTDLYREFQVDTAGDDAVRVDVVPSRLSLRHRRTYNIAVNGRDRFAPSRFDEVLPYVEWAVNWELADVQPRFLQLHASSLEYDGQGIIFPAASGSGKSTLALALLQSGWRYLCDEFALIHADTLRLHPFPRAICIKKSGFDVAASIGIEVNSARHYHKGTKGPVAFLNPLKIRPACLGRVCPVRFVVFPQYVPRAKPTLMPMSRAEAALQLHHVCFNLFGCRTLGVDVLAGVIRRAACFRLISSDLPETCNLLTHMVEESKHEQARCA